MPENDLLLEHSEPDWGPPESPELCNIRFREVGDNVERWVWEKNATRWELASTKTRAEMDAGAARVFQDRTTLTDAEQEHARRLARDLGKERGWPDA